MTGILRDPRVDISPDDTRFCMEFQTVEAQQFSEIVVNRDKSFEIVMETEQFGRLRLKGLDDITELESVIRLAILRARLQWPNDDQWKVKR